MHIIPGPGHDGGEIDRALRHPTHHPLVVIPGLDPGTQQTHPVSPTVQLGTGSSPALAAARWGHSIIPPTGCHPGLDPGPISPLAPNDPWVPAFVGMTPIVRRGRRFNRHFGRPLTVCPTCGNSSFHPTYPRSLQQAYTSPIPSRLRGRDERSARGGRVVRKSFRIGPSLPIPVDQLTWVRGPVRRDGVAAIRKPKPRLAAADAEATGRARGQV